MKHIRLPAFLLLILLSMLANACIPTRHEPFYSTAAHTPDAVVGRFSPADKSVDFIVASSLRGTVPPGRYHLRVEGPFGPPDPTPNSMPCPTWKTIDLPQMPNGATDGQTWVLLIEKAENGTLQFSLDFDYAAQRIGGHLISRVYQQQKTMSVNERQFVRWFKTKPINAKDAALQKKWQDAAPAWQ